MFRPEDPFYRLAQKLVITSNDCWEWIGGLIDGYGAIGMAGVKEFNHRLTYMLYIGDIPEGYQIDHLCRNRACCNPEHLEAVTPQEDTLRGYGACANNARKIACPQGHPYDENNTCWRKAGGRRCRACNRLRYTNRRLALLKGEK